MFVQKTDYERHMIGMLVDGRWYEYLRGGAVDFNEETTVDVTNGIATLRNPQLTYSRWLAIMV